ncbi:uncharacterized protein LOC121385638 [Gigantopelta aegis]|uniref:uncharacterized protein LOC121385638 n=1 Tax=Gigantopelta aegis TaxID=1735272 RepID=UPI001B88D5FF|nr:uncharacterized protein LOC121385638 [Gigantopelta aegis]
MGLFSFQTCQLPLQVTGSVQTKNATELWVVADGGASMYTVAFSGDLDVRSVTFWGSTANITGGVFTTLSGVAVVRFSDTQTVKLMLSDSKLFCTVSTSAITAPSASCEGEWPKSVKDLFGEQVGAIISTKQRNGIWAFGGSKIFKVIRSPDGQWELTETHDGATGTLPSIWENIPLNLIGASWIDDSLTKAFLLTKTYYVIYDIKFNSIVKRGYLCL